VRIRGDGGRSRWQHRAHELVHPQAGGLQVHMCVDETGGQRRPGYVNDFTRVPPAPAGDHAVGDGQVFAQPFFCAWDEDLPAD